MTRGQHADGDLGLATVERIQELMHVDPGGGSLRIGLSLDGTYRPRARHDDEFVNLRTDATFGPRFRELVGADD